MSKWLESGNVFTKATQKGELRVYNHKKVSTHIIEIFLKYIIRWMKCHMLCNVRD